MTGTASISGPQEPPRGRMKMQAHDYAELCVTTNFTFLTGASHPEEFVTRAAELGLTAIAITDRNSLAGVVRAYSALKILAEKADEAVRIRSQHRIDSCSRQEIGTPRDILPPEVVQLPKLITGCRLVLRDSAVEWLALPTDRAAYQRLTRLLTLGKRRAEKAECHLDLADLLDHGAGMILIALPQAGRRGPGYPATPPPLSGQYRLGAAPRRRLDQAHLDGCAHLALRCATPMGWWAMLMHLASRRWPMR